MEQCSAPLPLTTTMILESTFYSLGITFFISMFYLTYKIKNILYFAIKMSNIDIEMPTTLNIETPAVDSDSVAEDPTPALPSPSFTLPPKLSSINSGETSKQRERLIQIHYKTEEDIKNMSDAEVKKEYLKQEHEMCEKMSKNMVALFANIYTKGISQALPMHNTEQMEKSLSEDMFIKAAVNQYFPGIYFKYGALLAPMSIATTTAAHIDFTELKENKKNILSYINGCTSKSQPSEVSK